MIARPVPPKLKNCWKKCGPIGAASPTSGPQTIGPRPFWHNALVVAAMQASTTVVPQMQAENPKNGKILKRQNKQMNTEN